MENDPSTFCYGHSSQDSQQGGPMLKDLLYRSHFKCANNI